MTYATVRRLLDPIFGPRLRAVEGADRLPDPPYVLASNHVDFIDGFFLVAALWRTRRHAPYFLARQNSYGWTGTIILIPKDDPAAVIEVAREHLAAGKIVCNFPEGRRNHSDTLGPGKTGTVRLALAAGVPIVPVGLTGFAHTDSFAATIWHLAARHHNVTVRIGEPLRFGQDDRPSRDVLRAKTDTLMRRIAPLCGKSYDPSRLN